MATRADRNGYPKLLLATWAEPRSPTSGFNRTKRARFPAATYKTSGRAS
jgi:hypothetical protein